ncbi:MAG: crossover junction endodeoxyribonuclease RuvC [Rhodothermales bacterium]|nr:crossover junction endodeoxyribonuclease RuvC [Rhodothermales bacterium]MBO6778991.1 crossover junction endodeoxyribonuclease RuvC [Rhodothermales bacterium]
MIILGVDPGSRVTGYGVIKVVGGQEEMIEYGVLSLAGTDSHQLRLKQIHDRLLAVIDRCLPDVCAIEMPVYGKNAQSMLKLGRAQASAMLAALSREIPVIEYTPKEVKKSVTGNGAATKEQVWYMVRAMLRVTDESKEMGMDASDALAVSLCHAHRGEKSQGARYSSWSQFVKQNPGRVGLQGR